jgi:TolB protein
MFLRALIASLITLTFAFPANAALRIDITRGNADPLPIALPNLPGSSAGADIIRVVSADLERSGLFKPINQQAFIEQITPQTGIPRFADWRQVGAAALITGMIVEEGGDKLKVS